MTAADHRGARGDAPAVVLAGSGAAVTYAELDDRSMRLARRLHAHGLRTGDRVAVMLENHERWFEAYWAALRSGLYVTPVNIHLGPEEAGHIVEDSGATALLTSAALTDLARGIGARRLADVTLRLVMDGELDGYERYEDAVETFPARPLRNEREGAALFYTSGTTGSPKGVKPELSGAPFGERPYPLAMLMHALWGFGADTVFLSTLPLYHASALGFSTCVQRLGGTVIVMEAFDPSFALELVERHGVTHAQFVPSYLIELLKLDPAARGRHDLSSLELAIHATAPCPVEVKERLLEWWGPIVHEYFVTSEVYGTTVIGPREWEKHKGSVGLPVVGSVHILDDAGNELPAGERGRIWFESGAGFEYHGDPEGSAAAFNEEGWSALDDVGYVDDEGYLYVVDRLSHLLVRDGVTIYPQEIESELVLHPAVADVSVLGVPDADGVEQITAVVEAMPGVEGSDDLGAELLEHCRERLSIPICPTSVVFVPALPRLPTGKLRKADVRSLVAGRWQP